MSSLLCLFTDCVLMSAGTDRTLDCHAGYTLSSCSVLRLLWAPELDGSGMQVSMLEELWQLCCRRGCLGRSPKRWLKEATEDVHPKSLESTKGDTERLEHPKSHAMLRASKRLEHPKSLERQCNASSNEKTRAPAVAGATMKCFEHPKSLRLELKLKH